MMRAPILPESGPKRKILEAAEELFAAKGFDAVSVRDITKHCQANVASVNYHFGSRDHLVNLVMTRYIAPVNEERLARLDAAEGKWRGKAIPIEELIDAFVRPLLTQVKKTELSERLFCQLVGRIFSEQGESMSPEIEELFRPIIDRFMRAFSRTLPMLNPEELIWRMHFMAGGMIHLMSHQEMLYRLSRGASGKPGIEVTLSRFIRFASAGFREGTAVEATPPKGPQGQFDF
jgi:AcrR family transcriptional regulator